jgi:hypothetical protein
MLTGFSRVIDSFVFVINKKAAPIDPERLQSQNWTGVEVIGAVASLEGKDGPLAQCGWFPAITWIWMLVTNIQCIGVVRDKRFRGG